MRVVIEAFVDNQTLIEVPGGQVFVLTSWKIEAPLMNFRTYNADLDEAQIVDDDFFDFGDRLSLVPGEALEVSSTYSSTFTALLWGYWAPYEE